MVYPSWQHTLTVNYMKLFVQTILHQNLAHFIKKSTTSIQLKKTLKSAYYFEKYTTSIQLKENLLNFFNEIKYF